MPDSPQPPRIEQQSEFDRLLRDDPAIVVSTGTQTLGGWRLLRSREWMQWSAADDVYRLQQAFENIDVDIELIGPDGVRIWGRQWFGSEPEVLVRELGHVARREMWHRALLQLDEVQDELQVRARFEVPNLDELNSAKRRAAGPLMELVPHREYSVYTDQPPQADYGRADGPILTLIVSHSSPDPLHLAVLSVGEDRHHELVFPPAAARAVSLEIGVELRIPVRIGRDLPWPLPRGMCDRFFLIASCEPFTYPSFRDDRPPLVGEEESPLERWIARDLDSTGCMLEIPRVGQDVLDPTRVGVTYVDLIVY
jgi:hypothetical protein